MKRLLAVRMAFGDHRSELFGTDPEHTAFDRLREVVDANQEGISRAGAHLPFGQMSLRMAA